MKRSILFIIAAIIAAASILLSGCTQVLPGSTPQAQTTQTPPETTKTPILSPGSDLSLVGPIPTSNDGEQLSAQFYSYRANYTGELDAPVYSLVTSEGAFNAMVADRIGDAQQRDQLKAKYGEDFFNTHMLVIVEVAYSSGSVSTGLAGINSNDGTISIQLESNQPEAGTCDMAQWLLVIELDSAEVEQGGSFDITLDGMPVEKASSGSRI